MKKLIVKDKKVRLKLYKNEKLHIVLFSIVKNFNFSFSVRENAKTQLKKLNTECSLTKISNRCIKTANKKKWNNFTKYSRHKFLYYIRNGQIAGIQKSSW